MIFNELNYEDEIKQIDYKSLKKFESDVKNYFEKSIFDYQSNKFILLFNDNADDNVPLFVFDETNKLIEQPKDQFKLIETIECNSIFKQIFLQQCFM